MKRLILLLLALATATAHAESTRPNVLFIFLDDFGWRDTGFMDSDFYETPHLDRLASEGMVMTTAYSCSANCAPARASLLSGQYTPRHEVFNVGTGPRGKAAHRRLLHVPGTTTLRPDIRTWAHQIQEAGYTTASMGKWHLSKDPLPYGFDINVGGTHSGGPPKGYYPPHPNAPGLQDAPKDEYLTETITNRAAEFIEENADSPWCLYLTLFAVHTPIQAKKDLLEKYENKAPGTLHDDVKMATMVQAVDDGVGHIMDTLKALDLDDDTVVLFFADNGGYGPATDMDPLKGYKGTYYEGGIRVPFFIRWPGKIPAGRKPDPIIGVDLYPTLCAITGAELPEQPLDGINLLPFFKGEEPLPDRALFWHFPAYLQSYAVTNEQRDPLFRARPTSVIQRGGFKLIQNFEDGVLELYNLNDDIMESTDLAESMPEKTAELLRQLEDWQTEIDAPIPTELNPEFDAEVEAAAIARALKKQG